MSLLIHKPGILASIQDSGRIGYQHMGIPIGGAMDTISMQLANLLCNNEPTSAVIECTLHGTLIEFQQACQFALAGGGASATLNETPIFFHQLFAAKTGDILQLHPSQYGCRSYLAVQGGFAIEAELNSCSTYPLAELGGLNGSYLRSGDIIPLSTEQKYKTDTLPSLIDQLSQVRSQLLYKAKNNPALHSKEVIIRFHKGPEWDWFSSNAQETFMSEQWKVGSNANRMGYFLTGRALEKINETELISTPVTRGIIQVTAAGSPIVLMADSQTIGGYPRIGRVFHEDLPILAQSRPGVQLQFQLQ